MFEQQLVVELDPNSTPDTDVGGVTEDAISAGATATLPANNNSTIGITVFATNNTSRTQSDVSVGLRLNASLVPESIPAGCTFDETSFELRCSEASLEAGDDVLFTVFVPAPSVETEVQFGAGQGSVTLDRTLTIFAAPAAGTPGADPINVGIAPGNPALGTVGELRADGFGDPHLITFDGLRYDLQIVGEVIYAAFPGGEIQMRTREYRRGTSVISGFAAQVGDNVVEISNDLSVDGLVLIDGVETPLPVGDTLELGAGASVASTQEGFTVTWPGTGVRPTFIVRTFRGLGGFLNGQVRLPDTAAGQITGVLGNGDGNGNNEFFDRAGNVFEARPSQTVVHTQYADAWRLSDAESLFTYGAGESTATFTDLSYPGTVFRIEDLTEAQFNQALAICEAAGVTDDFLLETCIYDVAISDGLPVFAASAVGVPVPELALDGALASEVVLQDNPLRYYQFTEGSFEDTAGSGFDVTIAAGVASILGPILNEPDVGLSRQASATAALAETSDEGLPIGNDARTISAWVFPSGDTRIRDIVTYGDFGFTQTGNGFAVTQNGGNQGGWGVAGPTANQWHHAAVVIENDTATFYLDGASYGTQSVNIDTTLGGTLRIGEFGGYDEVAIFDSALSDADISDIYSVGVSADGQPCRNAPTDAYGAAVFTTEPEIFYRFDERNPDGSLPRLVADYSANCLSGAINDEAVSVDSPIGDAGLAVERTNGEVATGPATSLAEGAEARSISLWADTSGSGRIRTLAGWGNFTFTATNTEGIALAENGVNRAAWTLPAGIPSEFHHLTVTVDNGVAELYLDGVNIGSRDVVLDTVPGRPFHIGEDAALDEVAVYNRALTAEEAHNLYAVGASGGNVCRDVPTDAYGAAVVGDNPEVFYRFDEREADGSVPLYAADFSDNCLGAATTNQSVSDSSPVGDANLGLTADGNGPLAIAPSRSLPSGDADRTIEFWFSDRFGGSHQIFEYGNLEVFARSNIIRNLSIRQDGLSLPGAGWSSLPDLTDGNLHHIVFSFEDSRITLYVDGVSFGERETPTLDTDVDGPLTFGGLGGGFDELAIYDTALSAVQVLEHYEAVVQ